MPDTDALKKYLDAGMAFTQLTRKRAEQVVKDLVAAGELQRNQAKGAIDELVDRSRKNADVLAEQVRKEVDSQLSSMGLARKADVERLEAELEKLKGSGGGDGASSAAKAAKKASAKPEKSKGSSDKPAPPSKEAPAKKAVAKEEAGDAPEKPAKKAPAKKAASGGDADRPDMRMPAKKAERVTKKQG